jgi:hypothetical protein
MEKIQTSVPEGILVDLIEGTEKEAAHVCSIKADATDFGALLKTYNKVLKCDALFVKKF